VKINVAKWDVTYRCNLNCVHCDRYLCRGKFNEMSTEDALNAVDRLEEMGIRALVLTGGEPLLRKDIFEIAHYAGDKAMRVYLSTNGTLLNREMSEKIISSKISDIMISFDGLTAQTHDTIRGAGAFERTKKGSRALFESIKKAGSNIWVKMHFVLTALNFSDASGLVTFAHDTGFNELVLCYLMKFGNAAVDPQKVFPDSSSYLKALEAITSEYQSLQKEDPSFKVTLSLYPVKVKRYLEEIYHVGWDTTGGSCTGGIDAIHMASDGMVTPCDGGFHTVLEDREQGLFEFAECPHILRNSADDIIDSDVFTQCIMLFHHPRIYQESTPCRWCDDKMNCGVCPTVVIQNKKVDLCIEVETVMNKGSPHA
jgi:MoaA/NifB/PqqE/SkfB family radical SAM enzyme